MYEMLFVLLSLSESGTLFLGHVGDVSGMPAFAGMTVRAGVSADRMIS